MIYKFLELNVSEDNVITVEVYYQNCGWVRAGEIEMPLEAWRTLTTILINANSATDYSVGEIFISRDQHPPVHIRG